MHYTNSFFHPKHILVEKVCRKLLFPRPQTDSQYFVIAKTAHFKTLSEGVYNTTHPHAPARMSTCATGKKILFLLAMLYHWSVLSQTNTHYAHAGMHLLQGHSRQQHWEDGRLDHPCVNLVINKKQHQQHEFRKISKRGNIDSDKNISERQEQLQLTTTAVAPS